MDNVGDFVDNVGDRVKFVGDLVANVGDRVKFVGDLVDHVFQMMGGLYDLAGRLSGLVEDVFRQLVDSYSLLSFPPSGLRM